MLKKTYAFGLLAAATLGCFLTPAARQVKLRSISKPPRKMPQLLVTMLFPRPDQGSYQNQLDYPGSGYYHPKLQHPSCKSLIKMKKWRSWYRQHRFQDLDQHNIQKQAHKVPKGLARFCRFLAVGFKNRLFLSVELSAYEHQQVDFIINSLCSTSMQPDSASDIDVQTDGVRVTVERMVGLTFNRPSGVSAIPHHRVPGPSLPLA